MPRLHDGMMNATAFVYRDVSDALSNSARGGAAALFRVHDADDRPRHLVITNSHVVAAGGQEIKIFNGSGWVSEHVDPDRWEHAPLDDLAVAELINPGLHDMTLWRLEDLLPTPETLAELNVGLGDDVFMVGRLHAQARPEHRPVLAFGNIVSWPAEPTKVGQTERTVFLAEMRSHGGDSGAPVFVHIPSSSWRGQRPGEEHATMMPFDTESYVLLGINSGHLTRPAPVRGANGAILGTAVIDTPIALVVPWDRVRELLVDAGYMA